MYAENGDVILPEKIRVFLLENEKYNVSLSQKILNGEKYFIVPDFSSTDLNSYDFNSQFSEKDAGSKNATLENQSEFDKKSISGLFIISEGGSILHCIKNPEKSAEFLEKFLASYKEKNPRWKPFNVIGPEDATELIFGIVSKIYKIQAEKKIEYFLMEKTDENSLPSVWHLESFVKFEAAAASDFPQIFPMQCAYEKEEVIYKKNQFDKKYCSLSTEIAIKNSKIYVVKNKDNKILSKISINSLGKNYIQVGGVYTKKDFRKRGIGTFMVRSFTNYFRSEGYKSVLFAKKENAGAVTLYSKCGFSVIGNYEIVYF